MSVNSSSFPDLSLVSNVSLHPFANSCLTSKTSIVVFSIFSITNLLLLPLLFLVLYLGYQQWRKHRSASTSATIHSDLFMYHSIMMQLIVFVGYTCYFCGGYVNLKQLLLTGLNIWATTAHGQALFHILTCVERFLAVVHPITYLSLRRPGGLRIINISIGCVWSVSFGWLAVCYLSSYSLYLILYCCNMALFIIFISFFSIYALCALKRPGPGKAGGNKQRVHHSKQRAHYNIMAIMGVLLIRFGGNLISILVFSAEILSPSTVCVTALVAFWFDLPSSLVLPLLFLHRQRKLQCCKQNPESG